MPRLGRGRAEFALEGLGRLRSLEEARRWNMVVPGQAYVVMQSHLHLSGEWGSSSGSEHQGSALPARQE
jgi:hypothetical protein